MEICYKNKKLQKVCTHYGTAVKGYGENIAKKIHQRISEISSANTVEELIQFNIGDCHALKGDREGEFAMSLGQPYRLLFIKQDQNILIKIISIEDYH